MSSETSLSLEQMHLLLSHVSDIGDVLNVEEEKEWISRCLPDQELYHLMETYSFNQERLQWLCTNMNTTLYHEMRRYFSHKQYKYHQICALFSPPVPSCHQEHRHYEEIQRDLEEIESKIQDLEDDINGLKHDVFNKKSDSSKTDIKDLEGSVQYRSLPKGTSRSVFYQEKFDHEFRIMLLGGRAVGKTCFITRFVDKTFKEHFLNKMMDLRWATIHQNNRPIKIYLLDHQTSVDRAHSTSLSSMYSKLVDAFILMFDITNQHSFNYASLLAKQIINEHNMGKCSLLVGTKLDMAQYRAVTTADAQKLAASLHIPYLETSAKDGSNVEYCFKYVTAKLL